MLQPIHFRKDLFEIVPKMFGLTINATTHTFLDRSRKDLFKNMWVVALIVNRFEINAKNGTKRNGDDFAQVFRCTSRQSQYTRTRGIVERRSHYCDFSKRLSVLLLT